jgi:hypothetical protein
MRSYAVIAGLVLFANSICYCQERKKGEEKSKHSTNLETKKLESTALYLCNISRKLQQLEVEAERTGNHTKFNDFQKKVNEELRGWIGMSVQWVLQVESVGQAGKTDIVPLSGYGFRNQAQLYLHTNLFDTGASGIETDRGVTSGRVERRRGIGGADALQDSKADYDLSWARTLKRGDYIVAEGKILAVYISAGNEVPHITIMPVRYSTTATPKKGK